MSNKFNHTVHSIFERSKFESYWDMTSETITFGSELFGTSNAHSDINILCLYKRPFYWDIKGLPDLPIVTYLDVVSREVKEYSFVTYETFWKLAKEGICTPFNDIRLFTDKFHVEEVDRLANLRTIKIIQGYLYDCIQDLNCKTYRVTKLRHAARNLYIAECLIHDRMPLLSEIIKSSHIVRNTAADLGVEDVKKHYEIVNNRAKIIFKSLPKYFIEEKEYVDELYEDLLNEFNYIERPKLEMV